MFVIQNRVKFQLLPERSNEVIVMEKATKLLNLVKCNYLLLSSFYEKHTDTKTNSTDRISLC